MAKINITKPTGNVESLNVVSAFKVENNTYVILDSEKMGSMGLPIIYVCKYTTKLEKINDENEWQSVKNYLKGIIGGTNFEFVKIPDSLPADEIYYKPLTLPQTSFDALKSYYVVDTKNESNANPVPGPIPNVDPVIPPVEPVSNTSVNATPIPSEPNPAPIPAAAPSESASVMNLINEATSPTNNPVKPTKITPVIEPVKAAPLPPTSAKSSTPKELSSFDNDKETFLKACENMFDALISKYQKRLVDLETKEQELAQKEAEITAKLKNANEVLANAEAKEQVANIAHDNARRVMDLSELMPSNPDAPNAN